MRIEFCVFAVLCLINIGMVSCQVGLASPKKCADFNLSPMDVFQHEIYVGEWFTHQLYNIPGSSGHDCFALFTTPYGINSYTVTEVLLKPGVLPFKKEGVSIFNSDRRGIITYTSQDFPAYNGQYIVLDTDYVTYTIEVSCKDVSSGGSDIQLYIMSRSPIVTTATQDQIDAVIAASGLDATALRTLDITSCPSEVKGSDGIIGGLLKFVKSLLGGLLGGLLG